MDVPPEEKENSAKSALEEKKDAERAPRWVPDSDEEADETDEPESSPENNDSSGLTAPAINETAPVRGKCVAHTVIRLNYQENYIVWNRFKLIFRASKQLGRRRFR